MVPASSELQTGHSSGQRKGGLGKICLPTAPGCRQFAFETRGELSSPVPAALPSRALTHFLRESDSSFSRFFCRAMELEIPSWSLVSSSSFCLYSLWLSWEGETSTH